MAALKAQFSFFVDGLVVRLWNYTPGFGCSSPHKIVS